MGEHEHERVEKSDPVDALDVIGDGLGADERPDVGG